MLLLIRTLFLNINVDLMQYSILLCTVTADPDYR